MGKLLNPEMLVVGRESRGLTQSALSEALGIEQGTLSKYESGVLAPPVGVLDRISEKLQYPSSFFENNDRVFGFNSSVFFHRRRASVPDKTLRAIHARINILRFNVTKLLRAVQLESPNSFCTLAVEDFQHRPERVAQMVRGMWHVPPGPVRNVTRLIEDAGGIVIRMDFGTRHVDAISEWVPGCVPLFFVNSAAEITGDRLRLTLAHEVGHIFMHHVPNDQMEAQANAFAGELLMPAREIKSSLSRLTLAKLAALKSEWRVSMAALVERAYGLKTITEAQRRYLYINFASRGYKTREPEETDVPIEKPTLLARLIDAHLGPLGYSKCELLALLDRFEDDFDDTYGGGRLRLVS